MTKLFKIYTVRDGNKKVCIGSMSERSITHNRYSEGLLIAAGKLYNTCNKEQVHLKFVTQFHDLIYIYFEGEDVSYEGNFYFSNFDPESGIVVFGSEGKVTQHQHDEKTEEQPKTTPAPSPIEHEHHLVL